VRGFCEIFTFTVARGMNPLAEHHLARRSLDTDHFGTAL